MGFDTARFGERVREKAGIPKLDLTAEELAERNAIPGNDVSIPEAFVRGFFRPVVGTAKVTLNRLTGDIFEAP